jgi:hypothetical protein
VTSDELIRSENAMFSTAQFRRIASVVVKANPDAAGRFGALRRQLSDLLINVGMADDETADGAWFRAEANKSINHAALTRQFAAIAKSRVPLDHPLCVGEVLKELAAAARLKWPGGAPTDSGKLVRGAAAILLSRCSAQEHRDIAKSRAQYHASFVRRQRPNKHQLDTLIEQLADTYATITAFRWHAHQLRHEPSSQFVQFCHLVLEPFFDASEVSQKAIANRWKRLKDDAKRLPVPLKSAKPRKVRLKKRAARAKA